jgi:hypothetical protein
MPQLRFCLLSISNPWPQERIAFFNKLSKYKKVDSCGKALNNLGYTCPGRLDSKEYNDFIGQYKFMICFENTSLHNYMTEKLINAYKAGTIPIYWGCPNAHEYINMESILSLKPDYTEEDVTSLIKEIELLDNDSALYKKKFESIFFKDGVVPDLFAMDTLNMEICKRIKLVERINT